MIAVFALAAVSCVKEGTSRFEGNWSFKTSGTVQLSSAASGDAADGGAVSETRTASILTESGQMDIVTVDKTSGQMVVTMNVLGGDAVVMDAVATGRTIDITPFTRKAAIVMADMINAHADVTVSGTGVRYDDIIIFDLVYEGGFEYLTTSYELKGSCIKCVAKLNDY